MALERRPKILAVDDEALNLYLLSELLEETYDVVTAASAEECLDLLETLRPDLILLDVNMPGMNGYDLCVELKRMTLLQDVPILFLSALSFIENELEGLNAGAVDYIIKPFSGPILLSRIQTHLQLKKATQRLIFEQNRIGDIVQKMSDDSRFYNKNIDFFLKPMEQNSGDVVFSGRTQDNRQLVLLGDFTGHGLAAALCGSVVSTLFYTQISHRVSGKDLLFSLNQELFEKLPAYMFMVGVLLELDLTTQSLKIWNFGLPEVFHFQQGKLQNSYSSNSIPLGVSPPQSFDVAPYLMQFTSQDQLFVYSDGLTEMKNPQGKMLEELGLQTFLEANYRQSEPLDAQMNAFVTHYSSGRKPSDDITLLTLKTLG